VTRNYRCRAGIGAQMISWAFFFQIVFIFSSAFPGHLPESAVKSGFGVEAGIESYAQQRQAVVSGVLHFPGNLPDAVFINKIIEVFPERHVNYAGQFMRMYVQRFSQ